LIKISEYEAVLRVEMLSHGFDARYAGCGEWY
jgi:hypothetical protein